MSFPLLWLSTRPSGFDIGSPLADQRHRRSLPSICFEILSQGPLSLNAAFADPPPNTASVLQTGDLTPPAPARGPESICARQYIRAFFGNGLPLP